ncbi:hypothetical protein SLEP1_g49760 [Rubroshorea leprosula]|uniref:Uncharacterized protein n=1 Tax=Rubroshorea leprosula TaxID=152421 RepID=A0AAV5LXU2_9ROSI|nr:hypothetical protein SLEP1_g49760 [Rubroshorea leprosula]
MKMFPIQTCKSTYFGILLAPIKGLPATGTCYSVHPDVWGECGWELLLLAEHLVSRITSKLARDLNICLGFKGYIKKQDN